MPSRRIASSSNLSPIQERALNPFTSFDSHNINKLTRIVSNGKDGVVDGLHLKTSSAFPHIIKNAEILKSGAIYNDIKENIVISQEDRDAGKITTVITTDDNPQFKGFKFKNLTDIECRTVTYRLSSEAIQSLGLTEYLGTNTNGIFTFEFNLRSGSPREIIAAVGQSNSSVTYPRNQFTSKVKIQVLHNFRNDIETYLDLNLTMVVDPFDTYNEYAYCSMESHPEIYNGQSEIKIDDLHYRVGILTFENKKEIDYYSDNQVFWNYSAATVHPSKKLYVTPGVAIKDDVMLDEKGIDKKNDTPILELDVSDPKSWIKGNPFHHSDFEYNGGKQYAYVYNKYNPNKIIQGCVSTDTQDLTFEYGNVKDIPLIDDLQTSKYDVPLNWNTTETSVEDNQIEIEFAGLDTTNCPKFNDLHDLYGNIVYCIEKPSGKVIYKFELNSYEELRIFTTEDLKLFNKNNIKDKIDFVVPLGPIKVSGDFDKVNQYMIKWANVVIYYSYFKHPTPNTSYIGLIRDEDLHDPRFREDYLVLGEVRFVSPTQIDIISYGNRQSLHKPENQARNIDYGNGLTTEERLLWTDSQGHLQNPTTVSNAITLLLSLTKDYYSQNTTDFSAIYNYINAKNVETYNYINENDQDLLQRIINTYNFAETNVNRIDDTLNEHEKDISDLDNSKQDKLPSGLNGEVLYSNGDTDVQFGQILFDNISVCQTTEDSNICRATPINYEDIYSKWIKVGYLKDKQYGIDADYGEGYAASRIGASHWKWNSTKKCVENTSNSYDISGFVCPSPSKKIDVTVRFKSDGEDDDHNGLCLMVYDKNGRQHVITFTRLLSMCNPRSNADMIRTTTDTNLYDLSTRYREVQKDKETVDPSKIYYVIDTVSGGYRSVSITAWPTEKVFEEVQIKSFKVINGSAQFQASLDPESSIHKTITNGNNGSPFVTTPISPSKMVESKLSRTDGTLSVNPDYYIGNISNGKQVAPNECTDYFNTVLVPDTQYGFIAKTCPVFRASVLENNRIGIPEGTFSWLSKAGSDPTYTLYNNANTSWLATDLNVDENNLSESDFTRRGWKGFPGGVVLHLTYNQVKDEFGNVINAIIECESSPFLTETNNSYELNHVYKIRINIKDIIDHGKVTRDNEDNILLTTNYSSEQIETLKLFLNPKGVRWGYVNYSQPNSTFENIRIITDNNSFVIDREADKTYRFNGNTWEEVGNSYDYLLPGRQYYNSITNSLYWCDLNKNLTKISTASDITTTPVTEITITDKLKIELLNLIYPVGSIYISANIGENKPFGGLFGNWKKVAQGRCLWGVEDDPTRDKQVTKTLDSALPNIKGQFTAGQTDDNEPFTNSDSVTQADNSAIKLTTRTSNHGGTSTNSGAGYRSVVLNAGTYNPIYKDDCDIVQPPAYIVNIWQRLPDNMIKVKAFDFDGLPVGTIDVEKGKNGLYVKEQLQDLIPHHSHMTFIDWNISDDDVLNEDTNVTAVYYYSLTLSINPDTKYGKIYVNGFKKTNDSYDPVHLNDCRTNTPVTIKAVPDTNSSGIYTFSEWSNGSTSDSITISNNAILNNLLTYMASFIKSVRYTFNGNGNTAGSVPGEITSSGEIILPDANLVKNGLVFAGWSLTSSGGTIMKAGTSFHLDNNVTLYAAYTTQYFVEFNPNGGSGDVQTMRCIYGQEYSVPDLGYTKTNYDLIGFSHNSSASTPDVTLTGKFSNLTDIHDDTYNYYATWKEQNISSITCNGYIDHTRDIQSTTKNNYFEILRTTRTQTALEKYATKDSEIFDIVKPNGSSGFITSTLNITSEESGVSPFDATVEHGYGGTQLKEIIFKNHNLIPIIELNPYVYCLYYCKNYRGMNYSYTFKGFDGTGDNTSSFTISYGSIGRHAYSAGNYLRVIMTLKDTQTSNEWTITKDTTLGISNTRGYNTASPTMPLVKINLIDDIIAKKVPKTCYTQKLQFIQSTSSGFTTNRHYATINGIRFSIATSIS